MLAPYKETIERWVFPDVMRNQDYSVAKAKKAIADYKKAIGDVEGVAELSVYYCECCVNFLNHVSIDNESYFNALVRIFEQAVALATHFDVTQQQNLIKRLQRIRKAYYNWGWGIFDEMTDILAAIDAVRDESVDTKLKNSRDD